MAAETKAREPKTIRRMRRMRYYGLNNSLLSNTTVYLMPYAESRSQSAVEEAALYAAVAKYFNETNS